MGASTIVTQTRFGSATRPVPGDVAAALAGAAVVAPSAGASPHAVLVTVAFLTAVLLARPRNSSVRKDAGAVVARLAVGVVGLDLVTGIGTGRLAAGASVAALVVIAMRGLVALVERRRRNSFTGATPTVLVGEPADVAEAARLFASYPQHDVRPVATATPDGFGPTVLPSASINELPDVVHALQVEHVIVCSPSVAAKVHDVIGRSRPVGVRLSVMPPLGELLTSDVEVVNVRGIPVLSLAPRRPTRGPAWAAKRSFDFVASAAALLVLSPVLALVAAAIKLDSRGPVFFKQRRVGRNGQLFDVWKFRSMVKDAETLRSDLEAVNEAEGPYFKIENDPRVTRVGRWLRRLSIDELPQFFNVVRGEMSIVGPRPFLASELAADPQMFEWRMSFMPGITGLWQLAGRSWLPRQEGMRMDLAYVEHWSLGLDLRIILGTLRVALQGDRRPSVLERHPIAPLDRGSYVGAADGDDLVPAPAPVDASVVVVSHESADDIRACLASLRQLRESASFEVILVDNASTDGTADIAAAEFPEVRLIRKRRRDGFSFNCNMGAVAAAGRHVLMLNPDTEVFPGIIDTMVSYLDAHPEVGAAGPRVVYPDGSLQSSARRFPTIAATIVRRTPLRLVFRNTAATRRHLMVDDELDRAVDVDWLLGAALAVRGDAFRHIGGFDEGYRLYCEDIDLCWRLQDRGWAVRYVPMATVTHALGEHTLKQFLTVRTLWHFRSMFRFVRLHGLRRPGRDAVRPPVLSGGWATSLTEARGHVVAPEAG